MPNAQKNSDTDAEWATDASLRSPVSDIRDPRRALAQEAAGGIGQDGGFLVCFCCCCLPPPPQWGVDLNSSNSGYARLGSGVAPVLGMVKGEVAVLIALVRRHRRAVGAAVRRAVDDKVLLLLFASQKAM